jgi:hypothetical protein
MSGAVRRSTWGSKMSPEAMFGRWNGGIYREGKESVERSGLTTDCRTAPSGGQDGATFGGHLTCRDATMLDDVKYGIK